MNKKYSNVENIYQLYEKVISNFLRKRSNVSFKYTYKLLVSGFMYITKKLPQHQRG